MVTTRITDAVPMTMPRPVSSERTGLARSACVLKRMASPKNIGGLPAADLAQELGRLSARRIVRRQIQAEVPFQKAFGLRQVVAALYIDVGANEYQACGIR